MARPLGPPGGKLLLARLLVVGMAEQLQQVGDHGEVAGVCLVDGQLGQVVAQDVPGVDRIHPLAPLRSGVAVAAGARVVSASLDHTVKVWDGHPTEVWSAHFDAAGARGVAVSGALGGPRGPSSPRTWSICVAASRSCIATCAK